MKLNKIGEVWNSANRLLSDFIGLLSSKNFDTMATWRNDFSSLFHIGVFTRYHQFQAIHGDTCTTNGTCVKWTRSSLDGPFHGSFRTFFGKRKTPQETNLRLKTLYNIFIAPIKWTSCRNTSNGDTMMIWFFCTNSFRWLFTVLILYGLYAKYFFFVSFRVFAFDCIRNQRFY